MAPLTEKRCKQCGITKPKTEFHLNPQLKGGVENTCKACRDTDNIHRNVARGRHRKRLIVEKLGGKCQVCEGVFHPAAFDFHHIDPKTKSFSIGGGNMANRSLKSVEDEVAKCLMLCSNCHRTFHALAYEETLATRIYTGSTK